MPPPPPGRHLPEEVALSPAPAPSFPLRSPGGLYYPRGCSESHTTRSHARCLACWFAQRVSDPKFPQTQSDRPLETSELRLHGKGGRGSPVLKEDTAPSGLNVAAPTALPWSLSSWWEPPSIEPPTAHGPSLPGAPPLPSFIHASICSLSNDPACGCADACALGARGDAGAARPGVKFQSCQQGSPAGPRVPGARCGGPVTRPHELLQCQP